MFKRKQVTTIFRTWPTFGILTCAVCGFQESVALDAMGGDANALKVGQTLADKFRQAGDKKETVGWGLDGLDGLDRAGHKGGEADLSDVGDFSGISWDIPSGKLT